MASSQSYPRSRGGRVIRIAYGIHGYGRGHATRALAVLPELCRRHELRVFAGGDAHEAIHRDFPVIRIPTLGYYYRASGTRSNYLTLARNLPGVVDLLWRGPAAQMIEKEMRDFSPDVVIADAEPWTHGAATRLRIPRIGFDHFGVLAYCRADMSMTDRVVAARDAWIYRNLMGQPERVIVSSFFDAPPRRAGVKFVGPLLRDEVYELRPTVGDYLLAYFNKGMHLFNARLEAALVDCGLPVRVYGTNRLGANGPLIFCRPSNRAFLQDLAGCRAVVSTAGNQLVGEALHLQKPMLVMPEDCVEQRVNARAVERLGIGRQVMQRAMCSEVIRRFIGELSDFLPAIRATARDGRSDAVAAIEHFAAEVTGLRTAAPSGIRVA